MMRKLGVVTVGQAPRSDVTPILQEHLGNQVEIIQVGVLDGMSKKEIDRSFFPATNDYVLTSRLLTGESVVISREKIQPILQQKIFDLEDTGCKQILVLCTGVFHGLTTKHAFLIEPDQIIPPAVAAMVRDRKLGVITPLPEQQEIMAEKWRAYGLSPLCAVASPYRFSREELGQAAELLAEQGAELILLDCMGYVEEMRKIVQERSGLPVILSNALMAKLISEMI